MRRKLNDTGLRAFLEHYQATVGTSGGDLGHVVSEYWKAYRRDWKRAKRRECKSVEVLLNRQEYRAVQKKAHESGLSVTRFIKQAALAKQRLFGEALIAEVRELLVLNYFSLEQNLTDGDLAPGLRQEVLKQLLDLEQRILEVFQDNIDNDH